MLGATKAVAEVGIALGLPDTFVLVAPCLLRSDLPLTVNLVMEPPQQQQQ